MDFLRDMRNAAIANGLIVAFHVYVALLTIIAVAASGFLNWNMDDAGPATEA